MRRLSIALVICAALACSSALAQSTLPSVESTPPEELRRDSPPYTLHLGVLASNDALRFREGEVRVQQGVLRAGDVIVSVPVRHRRTFVLTAPYEYDLLGRTFPVGTRGYWAEDASAVITDRGSLVLRGRGEFGAMWCLFADGERLRSRCFFEGRPADCDDNELVPVGCLVSLPYPQIAPPQIEDRAIAFSEDLRVEYVLRPWTRSRAILEVRLNGRRLVLAYGEWGAEDGVDFSTVVGRVRVEKIGANRSQARVTVIPYTADEIAALDARPLNRVVFID